jgi:hypothetical protein
MGRRGTDAHWIFHVTPTGFFFRTQVKAKAAYENN